MIHFIIFLYTHKRHNNCSNYKKLIKVKLVFVICCCLSLFIASVVVVWYSGILLLFPVLVWVADADVNCYLTEGHFQSRNLHFFFSAWTSYSFPAFVLTYRLPYNKQTSCVETLGFWIIRKQSINLKWFITYGCMNNPRASMVK